MRDCVALQTSDIPPGSEIPLDILGLRCVRRVGALMLVILDGLEQVAEVRWIPFPMSHGTLHHLQIGEPECVVESDQGSPIPNAMEWAILLHRAFEKVAAVDLELFVFVFGGVEGTGGIV